jgi:hypothetical protein
MKLWKLLKLFFIPIIFSIPLAAFACENNFYTNCNDYSLGCIWWHTATVITSRLGKLIVTIAPLPIIYWAAYNKVSWWKTFIKSIVIYIVLIAEIIALLLIINFFLELLDHSHSYFYACLQFLLFLLGIYVIFWFWRKKLNYWKALSLIIPIFILSGAASIFC